MKGLATSVEPIAAAAGVVGPAWRALQAILSGRDVAVPLRTLVWLAGIGETPGVALSTIKQLIDSHWIETCEGEQDDYGTLAPYGAYRLGLTLTYPEWDGVNTEPLWIRADRKTFDRTGLHPGEPDHFVIQLDPVGFAISRLREYSARCFCSKLPKKATRKETRAGRSARADTSAG